MLNIEDLSRIKGFRFPLSVIGYAVWAYHRFALSLRDVEDLLAERGVSVSYETIRDWANRLGHQFAAKIRRDRSAPADKWHLDEVVIRIKGRSHWLWRAVDAKGDVLEFLIQSRRNKAAALRFLRKLMKRWGQPRVLVTDKTAILRRRQGTDRTRRRTSSAQRVKQQERGVPSAHAAAREDHGPFQIAASGTAVSIRPRSDR